jgi:Pvc16 N-terminal domain
MSNALAIAGVTAVLQHYLYNLYQQPSVSSSFPSPVYVTCFAPDQVQQQFSTGTTENQVNLFLHLVTPNAAWRNVGYASLSSDGKTAIGNPPLALDLHYLLTAYGSDPWQAEALLGFALMMLHQAPVITRADIDTALAARATSTYPYSGYPLNSTLPLCGLGSQMEMIKIIPESMTREDLAWLWTALKADYRPTFPFQVSVALLQPDVSTSYALPVLKVAFNAVPEPQAQILSIQTVSGQPAAQPGEQVVLTGEFLTGADLAVLTHQKLGTQIKFPPLASPPALNPPSGTSFTFALPNSTSANFPAGLYDLALQWTDPVTKAATATTNTVPFAIAAWLPNSQAAGTTPSGSMIQLTLSTFAPPIFPGQAVSLSLSNIPTPSQTLVCLSADAQPLPDDNPATTLTFLFDTGLPTAVDLLARLIVDGVPSIVQITTPPSPLTFSGPWVTL